LKPLPRSFYLRPTLKVAQELLGKYFVHHMNEKPLIGKIVEVEVYRQNDPASHSFRGKTKRNEVMFEKGGHLYVYFTYGMHFCANVVTGRENIGEAVLIRAVEPFTGIELMMRNRYGRSQSINLQSMKNLTNGPAKFCKAFDLTKKENGFDLIGRDIFIAEGDTISTRSIGRSPRIGIRAGMEKRWRFFIKGNPWVSR
jgi:DNA-3-methyladenine glycosylase